MTMWTLDVDLQLTRRFWIDFGK